MSCTANQRREGKSMRCVCGSVCGCGGVLRGLWRNFKLLPNSFTSPSLEDFKQQQMQISSLKRLIASLASDLSYRSVLARWMARVRLQIWASGWPCGCSQLANSPVDRNVPAESKYTHLLPFPFMHQRVRPNRTSLTEETSKMKLKIGTFG